MKLGKRKLPDGSISYYLDDFHQGVRIRKALGVIVPPGMDSAFAKAQKRLAETVFQSRAERLKLEREGLLKPGDGITIVGYVEKLAVGRNKQDHLVKLIPYLRTFFVERSLLSLTGSQCDEFRVFLTTTRSPATGKPLAPKTAKHLWTAFGFAMNKATVRDKIFLSDPMNGTGSIKVPQKIVVALDFFELTKLWRTPISGKLGAAVREAFFLASFTGLRLSDLRKLSSGDIRVDAQGNWTLVRVQSKTGVAVTVPIHEFAKAILGQRMTANRNDRIFPELQTGADIQKYVAPWGERAGLDRPLNFHLSRHTYGTAVAASGANALLISNLMGHVSPSMTRQYVQNAAAGARQLIESALPTLGGPEN